MTATPSITRRFVAGSGIALSLLGPVTASYGTCDERADRRASSYGRRADHVVQVCVRGVERRGGTCPDERTAARLARLRGRVLRVHGWRCPTDVLAARLDALADRVFCHRLARCDQRFGSMRLAVSADGPNADGGNLRRLAAHSGWSGIAHDLAILEGAGFVSELTGCGAAGDGRCELFARTAGTPFGAPSPISAGGVPVCLTVDFASDVVGHVDLVTGDLTESATVTIGVYVDGPPERPCPACVAAGGPRLGARGTCAGGTDDGAPCVVGGLAGEEWGDYRGTSDDCRPRVPALATFRSVATATTGAVARVATLPCTEDTGSACWCTAQARANACADGACTATPAGGSCALGPVEARCERASYAFCAVDADCPPGDRCGEARLRTCFLDPIVLAGSPSPPENGVAHPTLVGVFCMASTGAGVVDAVAGYPGPTAFVWPTEVTFAD